MCRIRLSGSGIRLIASGLRRQVGGVGVAEVLLGAHAEITQRLVQVGYLLPRVAGQRDRRADFDRGAGRDEVFQDDAGRFGFDVDVGLVGFDGRDRFFLGELGVLGDLPFGQDRVGGVGGDTGHSEQCRHLQASVTSASLSAISSDCAMAARSRTLLMLGDASPPVTRSTGWSSQSNRRRWISSASQPP